MIEAAFLLIGGKEDPYDTIAASERDIEHIEGVVSYLLVDDGVIVGIFRGIGDNDRLARLDNPAGNALVAPFL